MHARAVQSCEFYAYSLHCMVSGLHHSPASVGVASRTFAKKCICNRHSFAVICINLMRIPWKFVTYCARARTAHEMSTAPKTATSRTDTAQWREMVFVVREELQVSILIGYRFEETLETIWRKSGYIQPAYSAQVCSIQTLLNAQMFREQAVAIKSKVFRTRYTAGLSSQP